MIRKMSLQRTLPVVHDIQKLNQRELAHKGIQSNGASFSSRLLAWIEISPQE
jgi:hypothetical protein